MQQDAPTPPLGAWIVALIVVGTLTSVVLAHATSAGAPASLLFVGFNEERLAAAEAGAGGTRHPLVIMLGTSALKYATYEDLEFGRRVAERVGYPVDVIRIVNNWGVFGDFEPLAQTIQELEPDLLVLQQELLVTDRPWWRHLALEVDYLKWRFVGRRPWDHRNEIPERVQFEQPCWERRGVHEVESQLVQREEWVTVAPDGPDARAARGFVAAAAARKIPVALIDVPRRPDLEDEANAPRRAALERPDIVATIELGETWIPPTLPSELYCDISHVSPEGRSTYSSWLEQRVAEALAAARPDAATSGIALGAAARSLEAQR